MYQVTKTFFDPFKKTYVNPGEEIEIPEQHLEGYLPYVVKIENATKKEVVEVKKHELPAMRVIEKSPKKKVK